MYYHYCDHQEFLKVVAWSMIGSKVGLTGGCLGFAHGWLCQWVMHRGHVGQLERGGRQGGLQARGFRTLTGGWRTDWCWTAVQEAHCGYGTGAGAGLAANALFTPSSCWLGRSTCWSPGSRVHSFPCWFHQGNYSGNGTVHRIRLHSSEHGDIALFWNSTMTKIWPEVRGSLGITRLHQKS